MQHGYFFYRDNKCMHLFRKNWRTGNLNGGCLCYPSNKNQVPEKIILKQMIQLYIHADPRHDGWKQMQVHTKRSLTTIPTCGRQGSTTTNTKLTYNLFTPGPSVRLVENLAEDQLPLLLLLQVPEVVLVHHPVGPLLV